LAKQKRVIHLPNGESLKLSNMDLREWIDPYSCGAQEIYDNSVSHLASLLNDDLLTWLGHIETFGLHNLLASFCHSIVNVAISYVGDVELFKRVDWWELPSECYQWKMGDCEDTTFLLTSVLGNVAHMCEGLEGRYYAVLGYYRDLNEYYGHAYVLYYHNYFGQWCILETTLDKKVSPFIWLNWNRESYVPAIIFNRDAVYNMKLRAHREGFKLDEEWYNKHKEHVGNMVDYVTTGRQLTCSWMHKGVRPAKIELGDLIGSTPL